MRARGIPVCCSAMRLALAALLALTASHAAAEEVTSTTTEGDAPEEAESGTAQPVGPALLYTRELTDQVLARMFRTDLASLGTVSVGFADRGRVINAMQMPRDPAWIVERPTFSYATRETIEGLMQAFRSVHRQFPDSAPARLSHLGAKDGGPLRPHRSHQSGRDADVGFFYKGDRFPPRGVRRELFMDPARNWALIRALVTETDVEMILIDHTVQSWIRRYALEQGEDAGWVDGLFQGKGALRPIVRHAPGHATHIHVRFFNPVAQETARRTQGALTSAGVLPELVSYLRHKARRGDTLAKIAKKYGVSVEAMKEANGLRSSKIREQREYRIPVRSRAPVLSGAPLRFPARRLPPGSAGHEPERTSATFFQREALARAANPAQPFHAE